MTIQQFCRFFLFVLGQRTAYRSVTWLMLLVFIVMGLPALSGAQQTCRPDGDVDQSGSVTAADALLAFQQALNLAQLSVCQLTIADVFPLPFEPDRNITASDALCIFQRALGLPSCLDTLPPPNEPPVVNAGMDQSVDAGMVITLSGMASDPDGDIAGYLWEQTGGMMVMLSGVDSAMVSFTAPDVSADAMLTFRLTVTDDDGAPASDEVTITVRRVNQLPVVNVGMDQTVDAGTVVTLSGTASDPEGRIVSYLWEQTGGMMVTLAGVDSAMVSFTAPDVSADAMLTFRLTVTDDDGAPASDEVTITVRRVNQLPVVNVGMDQTVDAGTVVTLSGTASDPEGRIVSYLWEQTGGMMVTLAGADSAMVSFTAPGVSADAMLTFRLTVTDDEGAQANSEVMVTVRVNQFVSVSAGLWFTCGLRETGVVECWGYDDDGQSTPPEGTFTSVSAGGVHTCGLRDTGAVECWGLDDEGQSTPPEGRFTSVSAGRLHTCGLRETGVVECWGYDADGQSTPPAGMFTSVSAGAFHTCGLRDTDSAECWGRDNYGQSTPPDGSFASISGGLWDTCGVLSTGLIECWGRDFQGFALDYTFTSVSAGGSHFCGVFATGGADCWGSPSRPPAGAFIEVSAGLDHACGILDTGAVKCWGSDEYNQSTPPGEGALTPGGQWYGTFTSISAGGTDPRSGGGPHTCGLRDTGVVECRGHDDNGQSTPPPGTFISVSAGDAHTCGLRDTGTVECWGSDGNGRSTPPEGRFSSVSAGALHNCGVLDTGAVQCWGWGRDGQAAPPQGTFTSVSAGGFHSCGVLDTGAVQCWGDDGDGQSALPQGTFASVSAGRWHTCGLSDTGVVECWGYDESGQSTPPEGRFNSVSAGEAHSCGVLDTGAVQCWGLDNYGQSTCASRTSFTK